MPPIRQFRDTLDELCRSVGALPSPARVHAARGLAHAAIAEFWRATCGSHPSFDTDLRAFAGECHGGDTSQHALASELGRHATCFPGHVAAYLLSSCYSELLPDDVRSRHGIFFTPPPLVERLLDMVEAAGHDWRQGLVLDPAAGGGAFLAPVATRIADRLAMEHHCAGEILSEIEARVRGIELDSFAGWMSHVLLEIALWDLCVEAERRIRNPIISSDALAADPALRGRVNLVIGNPPYGRIGLTPEQRRRFQRSLYGHANLYGLFFDLAVDLAEAQGTIAFVTPASFLGGQYFMNLRALLLEHAPPIAIDFVTDRSGVFAGVLQETVLTVARPSNRARRTTVSFNRPREIDEPCAIDTAGAFELPEAGSAPWLLPRKAEQVSLLRSVRKRCTSIAEYGFKVSTGPLVWNRHKGQLRENDGRRCLPLIWAESILPDGTFVFAADRRNHLPFFELWEGQEHLIQREPCILVQRTTAKEQRRRLIATKLPESFIRKHSGAVVENHVNVISAVRDPLPVSLDALVAVLNSEVADSLFRCISGSVAVSAFELQTLPLPRPLAVAAVESAVRAGASRTAVERSVRFAYGLSS